MSLHFERYRAQALGLVVSTLLNLALGLGLNRQAELDQRPQAQPVQAAEPELA